MDYTFISGATGGIGKAFSLASAKKGYKLFLTGRSEEKLNALREELLEFTPDIKIFPCDLEDEESRREMYSFIEKEGLVFERIINVAGVDIQKAFMEYTEEKLIRQIRVNAESTLINTHFLLGRRAKNTEVITISSMSSSTPMPYFAVYSATKKMLLYTFKALRLELKDEGVKITTVLPGGVPTRPDIIKDIEHQGLWGKLSQKSPEYVAEGSLKKVKKNKAVYIPGFFNKLLNFFTTLLPDAITMRVVKKRWKNISKDAF